MAPLRDDAIPVTMFLVHHHPAFSLEESEGAVQKGTQYRGNWFLTDLLKGTTKAD